MPEENGAIQNLETPAEVTTGVATGSETNGADGAGTPASTEQTVPKWRMLFPDKWKKDSRLDGYNSLDEMMSGLFDGNTPQGTQTQEPAPAEPAEGDEPVVYSFSKQFPEGMDTDGVLTEAITQSLKEMKLTAEQADAVNSAVIDAHTRSLEAMKVKGAKNCENQLKQMWGDKYDENTALAKRATLQLIPEGSDLQKGINGTMASNNPYVVAVLAKMGSLLKEHTPPLSTEGSGSVKSNSGFLSRENETYPFSL